MARGKKYTQGVEKIEKGKVYDREEGVAIVKQNAPAKFDESIEVHIRLNIDPKKGDQAIRGSVTLPHGTGKSVRIAVITDGKVEEAQKAGADIVGSQELIDEIKAGKLPDVDVIIATPDMMPKLAQAAKVLGPRGLMPSPKTDTVTPNVAQAIEELKKGKENFKNDNTGNVHQVIGKVSFDEKKITENLTAFVDAIAAQKNDAHKGNLIATVSLCSTMGPAVRIK